MEQTQRQRVEKCMKEGLEEACMEPHTTKVVMSCVFPDMLGPTKTTLTFLFHVVFAHARK